MVSSEDWSDFECVLQCRCIVQCDTVGDRVTLSNMTKISRTAKAMLPCPRISSIIYRFIVCTRTFGELWLCFQCKECDHIVLIPDIVSGLWGGHGRACWRRPSELRVRVYCALYQECAGGEGIYNHLCNHRDVSRAIICIPPTGSRVRVQQTLRSECELSRVCSVLENVCSALRM